MMNHYLQSSIYNIMVQEMLEFEWRTIQMNGLFSNLSWVSDQMGKSVTINGYDQYMYLSQFILFFLDIIAALINKIEHQLTSCTIKTILFYSHR